MKLKRSLIIACSLALLQACSLKKDLQDVGRNARILFINASPDSGPVNIQANSTPLAANLAFASATGYQTLVQGTYVVNVTATGSNSFILNGTVILNGGGNYSFFTTDSAGRYQAALVNDDLTPPFADSARIRLIDMAPDGIAYDLYAGDSLISGGRHFNDQVQQHYLSNFTEVRANNYNIQVRRTGSTQPVASFPGYLLRGTGIYTVYLVRPSGAAAVSAYIIANL